MVDEEEKYSIVSQCLNKWNTEDKKTIYFAENFDEWIEQIPQEILDTVLILLESFEYYSQEKVNVFLWELHQKLKALPDFSEDSAVYTHIPSRNGIENSSIDYLYSYKGLNGLEKYHLVIDLSTYVKKSAEEYEKINHVVVIDDFCGSGKTFITFLTNNSAIFNGKTIDYVITYMMNEARLNITKAASELNLCINIICINEGNKAFELLENTDEKRMEFVEFSRKIGICKNYHLGYTGSEALVSFYNDTPNNTIGIFWCDTPLYFSIFPRDTAHPSSENKRPTPKDMKQQKKERNKQNYYIAKRSALNG